MRKTGEKVKFKSFKGDVVEYIIGEIVGYTISHDNFVFYHIKEERDDKKLFIYRYIPECDII